MSMMVWHGTTDKMTWGGVAWLVKSTCLAKKTTTTRGWMVLPCPFQMKHRLPVMCFLADKSVYPERSLSRCPAADHQQLLSNVLVSADSFPALQSLTMPLVCQSLWRNKPNCHFRLIYLLKVSHSSFCFAQQQELTHFPPLNLQIRFSTQGHACS